MSKHSAFFAKFAGAACFAFLFLACADQQPSAPTTLAPAFEVQAAEGTPTDEHVVTMNGGIPFDFAARVAMLGGSVAATYPEIGVAVTSGLSDAAAEKLARAPGVSGVERDMLVQWIDPSEQVIEASIGDNETFFTGLQWAPLAIHAPEAWDLGARGNGVRVAVIDGGLNNTHIDLDGSVDVARSASFVPGFAFNQDPGTGLVFSHATHVAGIIAAQDDGIGTIGIAPGATIIGVKVLHGGGGTFGAVIAGIVYAAKPISQGGAGANVINMSLAGAFFRQGAGLAHLANAVSRATTFAYQQGVTVIAAAGNAALDFDHTANFVFIPAQSANVIAVSATGPSGFFTPQGSNPDRPASYTNFGQSAIDFAAPGGDFVFTPTSQLCTRPLFPAGTITRACWVFDLVLSPGSLGPVFNNVYFWAAGTSMAAPHVAGVAALIIERNGGSMHPAQVEAALRRSADDLGKPGNDDFYGLGRVNALRAVQ